MQKIDHRQTLKHLYSASSVKPAIVEVPPLNFLMMDGCGKPDQPDFQCAAQALYTVSYTLKFMLRPRLDLDYHVMPMELHWKVNRAAKSFRWTMMIMQPDPVSREHVDEAVDRLRVEKPELDLSRVRFESFTEGLCVQYLHTGPYPGMDANLDKMLAFAAANGYIVPERNAHDIYLNDSRKTKPENLRAIMRLPVKK